MFFLILMLLASPVPLKKCILKCSDGIEGTWKGTICWYDEQVSCGRTRQCVDTDDILCKPWKRDLGPWDPITIMYP